MAEQEQALEIENQDDIALVKRMQDGRDQIVAEIKKVIVGQDDIIDELLKHYDKLSDQLRAEVPLKRIWTLTDQD